MRLSRYKNRACAVGHRPSPSSSTRGLWTVGGKGGSGLLICGILLTVAFSGGCSHGHYGMTNCPPIATPVCYPQGMCSGYFPTCWRRWPDECPGCPVDVPLRAEPQQKPEEAEPLFSPPGRQQEDSDLLMPSEHNAAPPNEGVPPDSSRRSEPSEPDESHVLRTRIPRFFAYAPNLRAPAEADVSDE